MEKFLKKNITLFSLPIFFLLGFSIENIIKGRSFFSRYIIAVIMAGICSIILLGCKSIILYLINKRKYNI